MVNRSKLCDWNIIFKYNCEKKYIKMYYIFFNYLSLTVY